MRSGTKTTCDWSHGEPDVNTLGVGSLVNAELSIGKHPAIVLSVTDESVVVVAISANSTLSNPEDMIEVPHKGLGLTKKCYVHCGVVELLPRDKVTSRNRKAWGPFLASVLKQVQIAADRVKKGTRE